MIFNHAEYFREWLETSPEELFVILHVYADESYTGTAEVFSGWMESPDYWAKFERRWKSILNDFKAPYFHFREFADKEDKWKIKGNPYLTWSDKKRDKFLYELAIALSESAVPIGGTINVKKAKEIADEDRMELLIVQFYVHFSQQLESHWPGFNGQVLFIFDETDNSDWISMVNKVHKKAQSLEPRIGGLAFESDIRCPPLQAADLYAYAGRQNSERYYQAAKESPGLDSKQKLLRQIQKTAHR